MFQEVWELGFKHRKCPSRSFKGIENSAILHSTHVFLLIFRCNYAYSLHRFRNIMTYFSKFRVNIIYHALLLGINQHTKFEVPNFTNFKDVIRGHVTIPTRSSACVIPRRAIDITNRGGVASDRRF